jgi:hypothetical protein
MTYDDEYEDMKEDKIRSDMDHDRRSGSVTRRGVYFHYYDGELDDVEIVDPDELLAAYQARWLEELSEDADPVLERILAHCWLIQHKAEFEAENAKRKDDGLMPRIPLIEAVHLCADGAAFLEDLIDPFA